MRFSQLSEHEIDPNLDGPFRCKHKFCDSMLTLEFIVENLVDMIKKNVTTNSCYETLDQILQGAIILSFDSPLLDNRWYKHIMAMVMFQLFKFRK